MKLKKYKQKRNFNKTPEPKGKVVRKKNAKLLYVIQKHAASHLHYDFRLELNGVLLSWAVPKGPCLDPSVKRLAMHVEDHPLEYGNFEGIIPQGQYGGGTVMLWDRGEWLPQSKNPADSYADGHLKFIIKGKKLKGLWKLIRINKNDKSWLLMKGEDEYAQSAKKYDITKREVLSVLSKQSMPEIAKNSTKVWGNKGLAKKTAKKKPTIDFSAAHIRAAFPKNIVPQLTTLTSEPPSGENWLHEIKLDGYRIIAVKKNNQTRLFSRNQKDWTNHFIEIAEAINQTPFANMILDGEMVVFNDKQQSDFQLLQNSLKETLTQPFYYYVFDLLYFDKYNLTSLPLIQRKEYLHTLLKEINHPLICFSDHVIGSGKEVFKTSCKLGLEGIVSKEINSTYEQKRSKSWLKTKCSQRQEFVIGGYTKPQGAREYFGALLLGTYNKQGKLLYHGNVGTGFTQASLKEVYRLLQKYLGGKNPFTTRPPNLKNIVWVKPILIAEIEFSEWTNEKYLRHPSFKGLREDKRPRQIKEELPLSQNTTVQTYKLTHPNKILFKEDNISKQMLAEYYEEIQEWILPYITHRPLTLVRCPERYTECFYQKHLTKAMPKSLHGIRLKEKEKYIYIEDTAGLLGLVQSSVLEIHPWGSSIEHVENPDILTFDLDPAPELPWKHVVAAAFELRKHLKAFKLECFVKTTGGKGLHVVIPIQAEYDWTDAKQFAHTFVNFLVMNNPDKYTHKMSKSLRKGKIFIDYLRNQRGATAIAPYSTRARLHAPVATPVHWDELTNQFNDTFYTLKTLPKRLQQLKNDPWQKFFKIKQHLRLDEV